MTAVNQRWGGLPTSWSKDTTKDFQAIFRHSYDNLRKSQERLNRVLDREVDGSSYNAQLRAQATKRAIEYWARELDDFSPCRFPVPQYRTRAALQSYGFDVADPHLLYKSCAQAGFTTPALFQAAWALVVGAYTTSRDVCFAYQPPSRDVPIHGPVLSALLRRVRIDNSKTIKATFRDLQKTYFEGISNQSCSESDVEAVLGCQLNEVANTLLSIRYTGNVDGQEEELPAKIKGRDIIVRISLSKKHVSVELQFNAQKVSGAMASSIASSFQNAVAGLTAPPITPTGQVSLLSASDAHTIWSWNKYMPPSVSKCVHSVVREHALSRPNCEAICSFDRSFTYRELDQVASNLAARLQSLGVSRGSFVPLCFDKSSWAIVSMLAVLKAGGAYVCVSPTYPEQRLSSIFDDLDARIVLASPQHLGLLADFDVNAVGIDSKFMDTLAKVDGFGDGPAQPEDIAYAVFTSGSTGKPKGVVTSHRAFVTSASEHGPPFGIGPDSRAVQFSSYIFDASIEDIFTSLTRGGAIIVVSEDERLNNLGAAIEARKANFAELTPTVARLLKPSDAPSLKYMSVGGEALTQAVIDTWAPHVRLINSWGPSEASVNASCSSPLTAGDRPSNIGKAVGCRLWIADPSDHNNLSPVGCIGEILIEGNILANGYLNDKEKTTKAFVKNPRFMVDFELGDHRMYKTGDLAYYSSDGSVEFVGRKDSQVKLRGQRFELGDVDTNLGALTKTENVITDILALDPKDVSTRALIAYIHFSDHAGAAAIPAILPLSQDIGQRLGALENGIAAILPGYMIPSYWIPMTVFPMSASGKIDRKRLAQFVRELSVDQLRIYSLASTQPLRQPTSQKELLLQAAWATILKIDQDNLGLDDNFLRSGGDSFAAMRLASHARAEGLAISVADIFKNPVLESMASAARLVDVSVQATIPPFSLSNVTKEELAAVCNLDAHEIVDAYPCTPLQEGLFAVTLHSPFAYTAREIFELSAALDETRLRQAFNIVAQAYPILRTRIAQVAGGGLIQVVAGSPPMVKNIAGEKSEYIAMDSEIPMTSGQPIWRFALISEGPKKRYLSWTAHHAGYDGWLENNILASLKEAYDTGICTKPQPFQDFIQYIGELDKNASMAYWQAQLSGECPATYPSPPGPSYQVRTDGRVSCRTKYSVPKFADILPSSFFRAAYGLTMALYSDSEDVIFASTLSGRQAPVAGIETIAGPTITTVPVRMRLDKSQTVATFLDSVHQQALEMLPHEHLGLQNIRRISETTREALNLQSLFLVQPAPPDADQEAKALGLQRLGQGEGNMFDSMALNFECFLDGEHVVIEASYDSTVIPTADMELIIEQFGHIVRVLGSEQAETCLQDIPLVSPSEWAKMQAWNGAFPPTIERCVHDIIAEQAELHPNAPAICSFDGDMTYAEVELESSKLAHYLVSKGIGPEIAVALLLDKSRWACVAMLAVLKAGGVCVSLSAQHPRQRLEDLLRKTAAPMALTSPHYTQKLDGLELEILAISPTLFKDLRIPEVPIQISIQPSNAAFIVFTSGTSGVPKGIILPHQAIATSSEAHGSVMGIERATRVLQFASFLYDVSIQDIFTTLQRGGTIAVISEEERFNDLTAAINRTKATWADLTSTVCGLLDPDQIPSMTTISLGGEPMKPEVAVKWEGRPGVQVFNGYGPAECSINSLTSTIAQRSGNYANIGTPLGSHCWVVDPLDRNNLKPIGTVGELLIEGPILAREYLKEKEKTDAAFITGLAWAKESSSMVQHDAIRRRFYATGDLVKLQPDGTYVYVGRADRQVKINGQRVELGEIESNVSQVMDRTCEVVVELLSIPSMDNRKALAAFLSSPTFTARSADSEVANPTEEDRETMAVVYRSLQDRLPSHMIPSLYFPVARLPVNASGKLDRRALVGLVHSFDSERLEKYTISYVPVHAPTNAKELQLRKLWCAVLKIQEHRVGTDSNFFGLGGDSISCMQLVAQARGYGLSITVAEIFQNPSLEQMAAVITESVVEIAKTEPFSLCSQAQLDRILSDAEEQCGLDKQLIEDIYPSTPLQEGLLAMTEQSADAYVLRAAYEIPASIDSTRLKDAWSTVAHVNSILRTRLFFSFTAGRSMQAVIRERAPWVTAPSLSSYFEQDERDSFRSGARLARCGLISDGAKRYLVLSLHHAVYDGWSLQQLFEDLEAIYSGQSLTREGSLQPFIAYLESQERKDQESFWSTHLGNDVVASWPQVPRSAATVSSDLSNQRKLVRSIASSTAQRTGTVPSLLLRAAWALTVSQYSSSDEVVMAVTLSGRDVPVANVTEITGPLLTTMPLRVRCGREHTVSEYLQFVQDQATNMIPFQHFGLQNIQALQRRRGLELDLQQLFLVQPRGSKEINFNILGLKSVEAASGDFDTYRLNIEVTLDDNEIEIEAVYDSTVIEPWLMDHVLDQYIHTIRQLATSPAETTLGRLDAISADDFEYMMQLNQNIPSRIEDCVHSVIEQQALLLPEAEAIRSFDGNFTYRELDEASNLLASKLQILGIQAGAMIPCCFDKSSWAIVSMLATQKAGAACVNISATYPEDRLRLILEDTKATVILASPQHTALFEVMRQKGLCSTVLGVDGRLLGSLHSVPRAPKARVSHCDPSYVIYTSGSTGRPKGVVVEHGALVSSSAAHGSVYHGPSSRVAQFASYTFDVSIQDIFTTLQRGGCVCVISETERMSDLAGAINRTGANALECTATVAGLLSPADVPGLEILSFGGEILTEQVMQKWIRHGARLLNTYGPTECAITCTYTDITSADFSVSNIGTPLGCVLWIVEPNDHHKLVPVGCVGEMLIEGPIQAREYLNDPEKTNAAFVTGLDWLPKDATSQTRRFYKSGDLCRYRSDGGVDFCGRKDHQVKINGLRIELGEIESQTQASSALVKAATVDIISPKARNGSKMLAAFVQFAEASAKEDLAVLDMTENLRHGLDEVKQHLTNSLPAYMVPALFFPLNDLPTSASGKLDRKSLKALVEHMSNDQLVEYSLVSQKNLAVPVNDGSPVLKTIREFVGQILSLTLEKVRSELSFVAQGGDSISAMRLSSKTRSAGIHITVPAILRSKNLVDLAMAASTDHFNTVSVPQATNVTLDSMVRVSPIQQWYFETLHVPGNLPGTRYNQSYFGKFGKSVDSKMLIEALKMVVQAHPMLRSRFLAQDRRWFQRVDQSSTADGITGVHEVSDTSSVYAWIERQQNSLDIVHGPVFSGHVYNVTNGDQYLFMTAHHLLIDIVSWQIILEDLQTTFVSRSTIGPEPLSFFSWTEMQAQYAKSDKLLPKRTGVQETPARTDLDFWGLSPSDRLTTGTMKSLSANLSEETTYNLLGRANSALRTEPIDLLLAAVCHSFLQVFPERDTVTINNEGHGREPWSDEIDISRTVGWFTTMYPLSAARRDGTSLIEVARQIKDNRRRLVDNGWAYFTSMYCNEEGKRVFDKADANVSEVTFNYHGHSHDSDNDDVFIHEIALPNDPELKDQGPNVPCETLFDINVSVNNGELRLAFEYQQSASHQSRIQRWFDEISHSIEQLCYELSESAPQFTLSDVPLLSTTYQGLDDFQRDILPKITKNGIAGVADVYPCTPLQGGLLISQARESGSYATEQLYEVSSSQGIDEQRFARAWQSVVNRHSALRTVFFEAANHTSAFAQVVVRNHLANVVILSAADRDSALTLLHGQAAVDYTLPVPPHRLTICSIPGDKLVCRFEASHTITDGLSGDLLLHDLEEAFNEGELPALPPVYRDFVQYIESVPTSKKLEYWKQSLTGIEPTLFPILSSNNNNGNVSRHVMTSHLAEMQKFCEDANTTLNSVVQTAWSIVLSLFTGTNDVCFGFLASGREAPIAGIDQALGAFVNMMICRANVESAATPTRLVSGVQASFLDALDNQHVALADIQHVLGMTGQTLFNTILSFQTEALHEQSSSEALLKFEELAAEDPTEYAIAIDVTAGPSYLDFSMDFAGSHINRAQATRILDTFENVILQLVSHENEPLANLVLPSYSDLQAFSDLNGPFPLRADACIHARVADQIIKQPDAAAIVGLDAIFTYGELGLLSDKLASHLQALGVGHGQIVPLCFPKTAWIGVMQLAVLKCGASCVSLGPDQPPTRLHGIIHDTGASLILCDTSLTLLFEISGVQTLALSGKIIQALPTAVPRLAGTKPTDTAFIVYTSGSTGKPKGVVLSHDALATSADAHGSVMSIDPGTRVLQFAAYTFDVSIQDYWTTLQRGGTTCVITDEDRMDPGALVKAINTLHANWVDITPSVLGLLEPAQVPTLQTVSIGGEAVPQGIVDKWEKAGRRVINGYGPAEASINAACSDTDQRNGNSANIGLPLSSWFWVTKPGDHNCLLPLGAAGELLIEGPQLADCYLNDEDKTKIAFITNPIWTKDVRPQGTPQLRRMYRTGDIVRMNEDGTYVCLGRADSQIKIRGQRVEVGEIEHHVKAASPVGSQVAVEVTKRDDRTSIVAFIEFGRPTADSSLPLPLSAEIEATLKAIKSEATKNLSRHMVPSYFVPLSTFPTNASNKLDRKRLRGLLNSIHDGDLRKFSLASSSRVAPTNRNEELLHELWALVLSIDPGEFGVEANFLGLGGDSVMAMKLAREVRNRDSQLSVADILRHQNLGRMAEHLVLESANSQEEVAYKPFSLLGSSLNVESFILDTVLPSCPTARDRDDVIDVHPVTDFQDLAIRGTLNKERNQLNYYLWSGFKPEDFSSLSRAIDATYDKFDILRSAFIQDNERFLQVVLANKPSAQSEAISTDLLGNAFVENLRACDLVHFTALGEVPTQFLIVEHRLPDNSAPTISVVLRMSHAQYDGTSLLKMQEFFAMAFTNDHSTTNELYHSESLHISHLHQLDTTNSLKYWSSLLEGSQVNDIATLQPASYSPDPTAPLITVESKLPLSALRSNSFTFATTFKAAWARTLASLPTTGSSSDIVFGTVVSGRNLHPSTPNVIGHCANYIPVRVRSDDTISNNDLLTNITQQALESMPHENVGFWTIINECTSWPKNQYFSSIVVLQDSGDTGENEEWVVAGRRITDEAIGGGCEPSDAVVTASTEGERMVVDVTANTGVLPKEVLEDLLQKLCENIWAMYSES